MQQSAQVFTEPPVLAGLRYQKVLGKGGSAAVYLYKQILPNRDIALKTPTTTESKQFSAIRNEAALLSKFAKQQAIVNIYDLRAAADGRPCMLMEYCCGSLLDLRNEYVGQVTRVLNLGVRIGYALADLHRANILHRDIKPSNIMRRANGEAVLVDFGAAISFQETAEAEFAISYNWAPPEIVSETIVGSVQSDIWSLAATLYFLIAGHPPFRATGVSKQTRQQTLIANILKAPYKPIANLGVYEPLNVIFSRAFSKDSRYRQTTIFEFITELQDLLRIADFASDAENS